MTRMRMLKANEIINALKKEGFIPVRQKGSHIRLFHKDGRVVTVPCHAGQYAGRGLLRKILRDTEMAQDDLLRIIE